MMRLTVNVGYDEKGKQVYQIAKDGKNYQNGNLSANRIEFNSVKGLKDGLYREWYPNGQLGDSCYYKADRLDGVNVRFSENGELIFQRKYKDGVEIK